MFLIWRSNVQGSQRPVTHPHQIGAIFLSFLNIHKSAMYISSSSSFTSFFLANRLMSWSDAKKWCYPTRVALLWPSTHMFTNVFIWWTGVRLSQRKVDDPTWLRAVPVCAIVCNTLCVPKCAAHCVCQTLFHVPMLPTRCSYHYWHKIQVFSAKNVKSYFYLKYNC